MSGAAVLVVPPLTIKNIDETISLQVRTVLEYWLGSGKSLGTLCKH